MDQDPTETIQKLDPDLDKKNSGSVTLICTIFANLYINFQESLEIVESSRKYSFHFISFQFLVFLSFSLSYAYAYAYAYSYTS
jgi:hypothetical protein